LVLRIIEAELTLCLLFHREEYHLTTTDISTRQMLLNGNALALGGNGELPPLNGIVVAEELCGSPVTVAPISVTFIAMYGSIADTCS
jgi:hypothetical protein